MTTQIELGKTLKIQGVLFIIIGILAIILPGLFTLTLELIFGILLLVGGVLQTYQSILNRDASGFWLTFLGGIAAGVAGVLLLAYPIQGILTLTLILAIFFIIEGIVKISYALQTRFPSWGWLVVSGVLAIIIGILIWNQFPSSARWVIGLLVGINLFFFGLSLFVIGKKMQS